MDEAPISEESPDDRGVDGLHHNTDRLLERARAIASSRRARLSGIRERVLKLLVEEGKPRTAYEIVAHLSGEKKVHAVQVYRALEFLQDMGIVHRLTSRASYLARKHEQEAGEIVVFMVCSQCGSVQEAPSGLVSRGLQRAARQNSFHPKHPIVEIEGECAECG